jgi:hypothetical protein
MLANKLITFSLTTLFIIMFLQISNAEDKTVLEKSKVQDDSVVNIVDPILIAGTEVLLEELF